MPTLPIPFSIFLCRSQVLLLLAVSGASTDAAPATGTLGQILSFLPSPNQVVLYVCGECGAYSR